MYIVSLSKRLLKPNLSFFCVFSAQKRQSKKGPTRAIFCYLHKFTTKLEPFFKKTFEESFQILPPPSDTAENLFQKDFRSKTGKIFSTFRILYLRAPLLKKMKRKFFGLGSPASFPKRLDGGTKR